MMCVMVLCVLLVVCGVVWLCCVVWCGLACGKPIRVQTQDASVRTGKTPARVEHAGVFRLHTEAS